MKSNPTYLIFGSTGLLGEAFCRLLAKKGATVIAAPRSEVDLEQSRELEEFLESCSFDILINCAGATGLEQCLDNPELAERLNVQAPSLMAMSCHKRGAKMVHFSTDYVFGGEKEQWVYEGDETTPANLYGETKLRGEQEVHRVCQDALVGRVSWLFGHGRDSLANQVLDAVREGEWPRSYITDKYSVPNFADDLVEMTLRLVGAGCSGIAHVCSQGPMASWHSYAEEVLTAAKELELVDQLVELPLKSYLADAHFFRAVRPCWTAMDSNILKDCGITRPDWRDGVRRYLKAIKS